MNLIGWTYLFEFGCGLHIYGKGKDRVGANGSEEVIVKYRAGPNKKSPRCQECLATHATPRKSSIRGAGLR